MCLCTRQMRAYSARPFLIQVCNDSVKCRGEMKRGLFSTSILGDSQSPLLRSISVFSFSSPPGQWNTHLCLKKFKCTPVALQRLLSLWVKMAARAGTLYHCPYLLGRYSLRQVEADVKTRLTFYSTTTFVFKLVINISFRNGRYLLFEAQWGAVLKFLPTNLPKNPMTLPRNQTELILQAEGKI